MYWKRRALPFDRIADRISYAGDANFSALRLLKGPLRFLDGFVLNSENLRCTECISGWRSAN